MGKSPFTTAQRKELSTHLPGFIEALSNGDTAAFCVRVKRDFERQFPSTAAGDNDAGNDDEVTETETGPGHAQLWKRKEFKVSQHLLIRILRELTRKCRGTTTSCTTR
jgi:hypothetical protein